LIGCGRLRRFGLAPLFLIQETLSFGPAFAIAAPLLIKEIRLLTHETLKITALFRDLRLKVFATLLRVRVKAPALFFLAFQISFLICRTASAPQKVFASRFLFRGEFFARFALAAIEVFAATPVILVDGLALFSKRGLKAIAQFVRIFVAVFQK